MLRVGGDRTKHLLKVEILLKLQSYWQMPIAALFNIV